MEKTKVQETREKIGALRECPECSSTDLIRIDFDALCSECDWNSAAMLVEAGELDDLYNEYEEMFPANFGLNDGRRKNYIKHPYLRRA